MREVKIDDILAKVSCLDKVDANHTYHKSYQHFVGYFSDIEELTERELVIGANFVYGWMPTIFNFKSARFSECIAILNSAKGDAVLEVESLVMLKTLMNNSIVGASKLLHFVNPSCYSIWDSRVCEFLSGKKRHKGYIEDVERFNRYLSLCKRLSSDKLFEPYHEDLQKRLGYKISKLRALEQVMFISSENPLVGCEF